IRHLSAVLASEMDERDDDDEAEHHWNDLAKMSHYISKLLDKRKESSKFGDLYVMSQIGQGSQEN
ncbi:MAG: hypothetical protein MHPSP_004241, partial [Paramarteilia canceri]